MIFAAAGATLVGVALLPLSLVGVLRRLHGSVGLAPPTPAMLAEENTAACCLFRHVPCLVPVLAWRSLGAAAETPVHECTLVSPLSAEKVRFLVKREDLISPLYGGNKVRTLQHQLATCEARAATASTERERAKRSRLLVIGSGGSNQVGENKQQTLLLSIVPLSIAVAARGHLANSTASMCQLAE